VSDLKIEIEGLMTEKLSLEVKKSLRITEDIDTEVDEAASNFGFYAVLSEKAETRFQKLKFAYEKWRAEFETSENAQRSRDGLKPRTEAQMKSFVQSSERNKAYQLKMIKLDEDRRHMKALAKAFELKLELVRTKSSNRRSERPIKN
jgi:hypothetical protein